MRVLIAGVSTRAAAESAARAGFAVTAIDAFADLDQHRSVRAESLGDRFSPDAAARHAEQIVADAVAYGSNFENHPDAVTRLSAGRALWGNPAEVLRSVRDPQRLSDVLRRRGLAAPAVAAGPQTGESRTTNSEVSREWLLKPRASGGGHRIRRWRGSARVPRGCYLQEYIDGVPASVVFVACGGCGVPIGLTRQLTGEEAFGVSGFRYCGNILTSSDEDADLIDAARALVAAVCEEFALVGVNGIDMVTRGGVPYAIEVNPRWCSSMELVERVYGLNVFSLHENACRRSVLPDFDVAHARRGPAAVGKAIVFARQDVSLGDARTWLARVGAAEGDVRDIPTPGTRIRAGRPVCTVFAAGPNATECRAELVGRAERVYSALNAML